MAGIALLEMFFAHFEMLWLGAAIMPLLVLFLVWSWRTRQRLVRLFVQSRLLAQLTVGVSPWRQKLRLWLVALATLLIILALARPLYGYTEREYSRRGVDIIVAIDTSRSMLAEDVRPNRLARAKLAALDLMRLAQGDRLALIAFAGTAFLQSPLTIDWGAFQESVNALDTDIIPQPGTALASVIETALDSFENDGDNFKALVIFTDGEDHETGALQAARKAASRGIRIYPVGVGTPAGDQLREENARGETTFIKDEDGQPVTSKLNDAILRQIAQATDGEYLPLKGADPMRLLYENRISLLPQSEYGARLGRQYHERFQWLLGLALLLLAVEMLLPYRRRVSREAVKEHPAGAVGRLALLLAACVVGSGPVQASNRKALKAYERGDYETARQELQRLIANGDSDPRLHYNAGVTAYRMGDFEDAANELATTILTKDPTLLDAAYYNMGNALFKIGDKAPTPQEKQERWEAAVQSYEGALALRPEDQDARHNRDVVKAKLELLKQQQEQQKQQQQQQDQNDQQKPQDEQTQQNQDQQQNSQQQNSEDPQNQDSQPSPSEQDQDPQNRQQSQGQEDSQKPEPNQPQPQNGQQDNSSDEQSPAGGAEQQPAGQMSPDQARQLLEAARGDEKHWSEAQRHTGAAGGSTRKPW
ncbi:MAG: VWA domain-containing protein [Verrucomicrobiales bacterium]|nr:VWA domain-containing protein [Verrucomicrobiales bacterium]